MYGLTEAFRSTFLPPEQLEKRPTSIGKAIPNTEIMVVTETGDLCGPNQEGELVHRGPTVSLGYWKRPDATAERFRPYPWDEDKSNTFEHVVFSGDLVYSDEDGFLYFVGRKDGMIKCYGHRISPTEIEEVVFQTGWVKEAAAIGVPDEAAGQLVKVFIIPTDDYTSSLNELPSTVIAFCSERLPHYMIPHFVEIVESLPKTATGKVDYPTLKKLG